ncbi:MAG: hypothetical protein V4515_04205 [Chloroflexota bacterium]
MDPQIALDQFGGLDTLDGSTPASDVAMVAEETRKARVAGVDIPTNRADFVVAATTASTRAETKVSTRGLNAVSVDKAVSPQTQASRLALELGRKQRSL